MVAGDFALLKNHSIADKPIIAQVFKISKNSCVIFVLQIRGDGDVSLTFACAAKG